LGPGRVGYSEEITCLTPPRIGTVFTLGHRATFLVVGSCYNTPPLLRPPGFPDPSILWVQPQTVLTPGSQIVLPNNPALVGVQRCIQTAVNTSRGWEFTAGVQVTVLQ
jgi:hypothetical protein